MISKITAEWLRSLEACEEQVVIFERLYPNGIDLNTQEQFISECSLYPAKFNWQWLANHSLHGNDLEVHTQISKDALANFRSAINQARIQFRIRTETSEAEMQELHEKETNEYYRIVVSDWALRFYNANK